VVRKRCGRSAKWVSGRSAVNDDGDARGSAHAPSSFAAQLELSQQQPHGLYRNHQQRDGDNGHSDRTKDHKQKLEARPSQLTCSCGGAAFRCDRSIPQSPIGWRAGRPREFLQTYRPRRAANRCDRGGAVSAARRIWGEGGAQSLPTPRLRECRHRSLWPRNRIHGLASGAAGLRTLRPPPRRSDAPQFFSTTCYVRPASLVTAMSVRR
jgi:hypothetical protein